MLARIGAVAQLVEHLCGMPIGLAVFDTYTASYVLQHFERASGPLAL